jgi:hypothetical protein
VCPAGSLRQRRMPLKPTGHGRRLAGGRPGLDAGDCAH